NWVTEVPGITSYVPGEVEIATSAPVIESTATYQGGNDNSHNVTLPSGIQAGDLLVMVFRSAESASTPSGWSLLSTRNSSGRTYIFTKTATGSEGSTVSVSLGDDSRIAAITYRISNWTGTPEAVFVDSNTNNPPSISPSWGDTAPS